MLNSKLYECIANLHTKRTILLKYLKNFLKSSFREREMESPLLFATRWKIRLGRSPEVCHRSWWISRCGCCRLWSGIDERKRAPRLSSLSKAGPWQVIRCCNNPCRRRVDSYHPCRRGNSHPSISHRTLVRRETMEIGISDLRSQWRTCTLDDGCTTICPRPHSL